MKATLYSTATVLPGNKIEIQSSELAVGQTVEVIILVTDASSNAPIQDEQATALSLSDRLAFLNSLLQSAEVFWKAKQNR